MFAAEAIRVPASFPQPAALRNPSVDELSSRAAMGSVNDQSACRSVVIAALGEWNALALSGSSTPRDRTLAAARIRNCPVSDIREKLTNEELIQLYDVATGIVSAQFELWLTITFAVIIASYIAGHRLARSLQYLIAALYTAVSVLLFLMLLGAVQFSQQFDALNVGASSENNLVVAIVVLRISVWVLGTVASIVSIFMGHREDQGNDA